MSIKKIIKLTVFGLLLYVPAVWGMQQVPTTTITFERNNGEVYRFSSKLPSGYSITFLDSDGKLTNASDTTPEYDQLYKNLNKIVEKSFPGKTPLELLKNVQVDQSTAGTLLNQAAEENPEGFTIKFFLPGSFQLVTLDPDPKNPFFTDLVGAHIARTIQSRYPTLLDGLSGDERQAKTHEFILTHPTAMNDALWHAMQELMRLRSLINKQPEH